MLRSIAAFLVGALVGVLVIWAVQAAGHRVHPPPANLDTGNTEQMQAYVASLPITALLFVLASYALGSLSSGWVAGSIARGLAPALAVGVLLLLGGVANVVTIPHPTWFAVVSLLSFMPCAWFGGKLGRGQAA